MNTHRHPFEEAVIQLTAPPTAQINVEIPQFVMQKQFIDEFVRHDKFFGLLTLVNAPNNNLVIDNV